MKKQMKNPITVIREPTKINIEYSEVVTKLGALEVEFIQRKQYIEIEKGKILARIKELSEEMNEAQKEIQRKEKAKEETKTEGASS